MSSIFKQPVARMTPDKLIEKMIAIVENIVTQPKFRIDFEKNDRVILDQSPAPYTPGTYTTVEVRPVKRLF